jgi:hypothetical protein
MCFAREKNYLPHFQNQQSINIYFVLFESFPYPGFYMATSQFKLTVYRVLIFFYFIDIGGCYSQTVAYIQPALTRPLQVDVHGSLFVGVKIFDCIQFCRGTKIACLFNPTLPGRGKYLPR